MYYQNKSLRHFERFVAKLTIRLNLCGFLDEIYIDVDFICAFSLRQLVACVRPFIYLPPKFCSLKIDFVYNNVPLPDNFRSVDHPLCMHNYQQIEALIIRNIVFVLSSQYLLTFFIMKESSKPNIETAQRGTDSTNFAEYAEVMRMAATANRMACNIALNVPMSKVLPTKDSYKEFIGALDVIQKYYYSYFKEYSECANIAKASEKSKETAASAGS